MADALLWLEALAGLKALVDLTSGIPDYWERYNRHRQERDTIAESKRVSREFSTYSDAELKDLIRKIKSCRDRFIAQGSGQDRARCLCDILQQIKDGNGGAMPLIDDWQRMYDQLKCGK